MTAKQQQAREKRLVGSFLEASNRKYHRLQALDEWHASGPPRPSGPDVKVNVASHGRVGLELTEYQSDSGKVGSIRRAQRGAWQKIIAIVCRNYAWRYPALSSFGVAVHFRDGAVPRPADRKHVARQLVDLVHKASSTVVAQTGYDQDALVHWPRLASYFKYILVSPRVTSPRFYSHDGSAQVGVNIREICRIIEAKGKKRLRFALTDVSECWLLICTTGETAADSAGPLLAPEQSRLASDVVRRACRASGFDRVILWDSTLRWRAEYSGDGNWDPVFDVRAMSNETQPSDWGALLYG